MALYKYEGKWYCEAKDLSLSVERLSLYLHRGRKSSESFQNIRNPYYHGRNSKRLVLLESLPERLRRQVEEKFLSHTPRPPKAGEEKRQTHSFSDSAHSETRADSSDAAPLGHAQPDTEEPTQQSVQSLTHLTSEAMLQSQSALEQALQTHIEATRGDYLEHYLQQGHTYRTALRCSRTCAFVTFLCEQEYLIEVQSTDAKAASLHTQALHANVIQVLSKLDISVPKSPYRYHQWWSNMKQKVATETCYKGEKEALRIHVKEAVPQAVLPKRQCNTNTCKLHPEAQHYIDHVYSQGNALPVRQIYEKLLAYAREQDWWHSQSVFNPPSYRTVALYVSTRQADLVLARQGESAHYTKYLPQIQRSLWDVQMKRVQVHNQMRVTSNAWKSLKLYYSMIHPLRVSFVGANVRSTTSFTDMYPRFSCSTTVSLYYSIHDTVNTQELEPDHPIHWYNGALAAYYIED